MKLEAGEFYLSAGGEIIEINYYNNDVFLFEDINGNDYLISGKCKGDCREFDLIAHIPKELHYELLRVVNEYHTNKDFKSMIDINFEKRKIK